MTAVKSEFSTEERKLIRDLVALYKAKLPEFRQFSQVVRLRIEETPTLFSLIHSLKSRVKEPSHLKDKLERKMREAKKEGRPFDINKDNLFQKITDLCGVRILHLHTRQYGGINARLLEALAEGQFRVVETPKAKTWDDETRDYFKSLPVETEDSDSMYTSVHCVIESNSLTKYTCEIQIRTLAEELWGEVSHSFTYPHPTESIACQEQIKVLARATSTCSRLVDSIYKSLEEHKSRPKRRKKAETPAFGAEKAEEAHPEVPPPDNAPK